MWLQDKNLNIPIGQAGMNDLKKMTKIECSVHISQENK